jgi:hypothetical protein
MEAEIASFEEALAEIRGEKTENNDDTEDLEEPDVTDDGSNGVDYDAVVRDLGYSNSEVKGEVKKPVVISPTEFGDIDDYEIITLFYYADGVLTDELDEPLEDIEGSVGLESLTTFGDYEEDAVHVRNDRLRVYYEILRELRNYNDTDTSANVEDK